MRPIVVTVGPLAAASANNIATSQTPVSGTPLTLNGTTVSGGVATLDMARRVQLTFGNEASARTMVITGTGITGQTQSETLAVASGAGATIASVLDYKTITSAVPAGGGYTAAVTLGTNGIAGSAWVCNDEWAYPPCSVECEVTGTANYTVQITSDDPNSISDPVAITAVNWLSALDTTLVAASTSIFGQLINSPKFARVVLNSGTGSVRAIFTQYGNNQTS